MNFTNVLLKERSKEQKNICSVIHLSIHNVKIKIHCFGLRGIITNQDGGYLLNRGEMVSLEGNIQGFLELTTISGW
jgi:hypothetical protein